jgi:hypothetical protein
MDNFIKATNTYDLTKNIKDLEINTGFILGLNDVLMFYITSIVKDASTLSDTFKKFQKLISNDKPEEVRLDAIEAQIYTVFALQQLLKAKAKEQNLEIPVDSKITKEDLTNYITAIMDGDNETAEKKLKQIQKLVVPKLS